MITKKQVVIINQMKKKPFRDWTFSELKESAEIKSNSLLQRALKKFKEDRIISIKKSGNMFSYSLNLSPKTYSYILISNFEFKRVPEKIIDMITEECLKETSIFSLAVFGSYAKGSENKDSDLDVAIFVLKKETIKDLTPRLNSIKRKEIAELHFHLFTYGEFYKMLNLEMENVGKEIARHHLIFYGLENFYEVLKKWKQK